MYNAQFGKRVSPATPLNHEAKQRNGTRTLYEPREQSEPTTATTLSIKKFALSVIALYVVASMVPRTMSLHMFSEATQKFVLGVTADDLTWAEHLNVGIKIDPKKLKATPRKVLMGLEKLKALSKIVVKPGKEQKPDQGKTAEEKAPEQKEEVWVARALHIVIEVASNYSRHGMALDFAVESIVTAIKCKTLMYILVQLHAIKKTHEQHNDVINSQPFDVLVSLSHFLDKVAVLKESIEEEFELYERWVVVASQVKSKDVLSDLEVFQTLVQKTLDDKCELSTLESIKKHIQLNDTNTSESPEDTEKIFMDCHDKLKKMFNQIPISTMNLKVWELFLNKPKCTEPKKTDGNTK